MMNDSAHLQSVDGALVSAESADGSQQAISHTGNASTVQSTNISLIFPADGRLAGEDAEPSQSSPPNDQATVAAGSQVTAQEPECDQSLLVLDTSPVFDPFASPSLQNHTQHHQESSTLSTTYARRPVQTAIEPFESSSLHDHTQHGQESSTLSTTFARRSVQTVNECSRSGNIHRNVVAVSGLITSTLTGSQESSPAITFPTDAQQDQERSAFSTNFGRHPIPSANAASQSGNIRHNVVAVAEALSASALTSSQEVPQALSLPIHIQQAQQPVTLSTTFGRRPIHNTNTASRPSNIHRNVVEIASALSASTLTGPQEPSPALSLPTHPQQDQQPNTLSTTFSRRPIHNTDTASRHGNIHHNVTAVASALRSSTSIVPQEQSDHHSTSIYDASHPAPDTQSPPTADNLTSAPDNGAARADPEQPRAAVVGPSTPPNLQTARLQNIENRGRGAAQNADPVYEHSVGVVGVAGRGGALALAVAPPRPPRSPEQPDAARTLAAAVAAAEMREIERKGDERREKNDAAGASPVRRRRPRPRGGGAGGAAA